MRVEGSLDPASGLVKLSFLERLSTPDKKVQISDASDREEYLRKAVAQARRDVSIFYLRTSGRYFIVG